MVSRAEDIAHDYTAKYSQLEKNLRTDAQLLISLADKIAKDRGRIHGKDSADIILIIKKRQGISQTELLTVLAELKAQDEWKHGRNKSHRIILKLVRANVIRVERGPHNAQYYYIN